MESYLNWGKLGTSFLVPWLGDYVRSFYGGSYFVGGWIVLPFALVGFAGVILLIRGAVRRGRLLQPWMLLFLLISPVLMSLALGTHMPNRTQQVLPLAFGSIALVVPLSLGAARRGGALAVFVSVMLVAWNAQANTRMFLTKYVSFTRDVEMGHRIADRLLERGWTGGQGCPGDRRRATLCTPRLLHQDRDHRRLILRTRWGEPGALFHGISDLSIPLDPTPAERLAAFEAAESMPDWPRSGSVALVGGIAIVKFGAPTEAQRLIGRR